MITGRNDPCWCGSGKKYKKCHLPIERASHLTADKTGSGILIKTKEQIDGVRLLKIRQSGRLMRFAGLLKKPLSALRLAALLKKVSAAVDLQRGAGIETYLTARHARRNGRGFLFLLASDRELSSSAESGVALRGCFRYGINNANRIICQSEFQRGKIKQLFGKEALILNSSHAIAAAMPGEERSRTA